MTDDPVHNHPDMAWDMAWQPIETAPMDGTRLWLYWPNRYKDDCQVVGWFYSSSDEFYWTDFNDSDRPTTPTHWKPLPPPPNSKE